jgi:hypothetical protein
MLIWWVELLDPVLLNLHFQYRIYVGKLAWTATWFFWYGMNTCHILSYGTIINSLIVSFNNVNQSSARYASFFYYYFSSRKPSVVVGRDLKFAEYYFSRDWSLWRGWINAENTILFSFSVKNLFRWFNKYEMKKVPLTLAFALK